MTYVLLTVCGYLLFNLGVYFSTASGSELALGIGYLLGCCIIRLRLRTQIQQQAATPINWWLVSANCLSILVTANALRYAHARVPLSLSMEAVYNGLAMLSWPTFLLLGAYWPRYFTDKPKRFDLFCHLLMFALVVTRFSTYGQYDLTIGTVCALLCGAIGYIGVNISIKLMAGHRMSSIYGILLAAIILLGGQLLRGSWEHWQFNSYTLVSMGLVAIASYMIPVYLAGAYAHFKALGSLVPPLVFDSLLVASPLVMFVRGETISHWTILVALGMVGVTAMRYRYHIRKGNTALKI